MELTETQKLLRRRILQISHTHHLSHLGSCLTAVDIIEEIYQQKNPDERFVLSCGHAGLALYVVLEHHGLTPDAEKLFLKHGVHPTRDAKHHLDCSTGSLGQGLPIAVGMALSDRSRNVYCLVSDGECAEGSIWEACRVAKEQNLTNLKIYLNQNGWAAYKETSFEDQFKLPVCSLGGIWTTSVHQFGFLHGQDAHYHVMTDQEYEQAMEVLK